jgi:acyl-coenzyme A synthetase/AMP-(fatty) acid ligase
VRDGQRLGALLDDAAATWGERTFLRHDDQELTFADARRSVTRTAAGLVEQGLEPGDRVLIALGDPVTAVITMLAGLHLGAVCAIGDPGASRFAAEHVVSDLLPVAIVTDAGSAYAEQAVRLDLARATASPPDAALIIYTSGSTGRPKGIVSSQQNVRFATSAIQERLGLLPTDRIACLLPLTFDYGLYQVFLALVSGCAVVFASPMALGPSLLQLLVQEEITVLPSVPTLSRMVLSLAGRPGAAVPPLRVITNTGEAMSEAVVRGLQGCFADAGIYPMFGLTECKRVSILLPSELDERPGSVGRALAGTRCEIVDEHGHPVGPDEVGQLVVTGPHVTLGYWRDDELTHRVFRDARDGTRWLFTGDKAWMDADGYLFFVGRDDDVFKRHGYRVSATEIAFAAEQVNGVRAAVCLPPAKNPLQQVVLVAAGSATSDEIAGGLGELLARHQLPDRIEIVDEIPLTRHGKADARATAALLADRFGVSHTRAAATAGRS